MSKKLRPLYVKTNMCISEGTSLSTKRNEVHDSGGNAECLHDDEIQASTRIHKHVLSTSDMCGLLGCAAQRAIRVFIDNALATSL